MSTIFNTTDKAGALPYGHIVAVPEEAKPCKGVVQNADSSSIDFSGDGSACFPLSAEVNISGLSGNTLSIQDDGLYASGGTGSSNRLQGNGSAFVEIDESFTVQDNFGNSIHTGSVGTFIDGQIYLTSLASFTPYIYTVTADAFGKLGTIPYVVYNADWNAVSGVTKIFNKPTSLSGFTNDMGYITGVTNTQVINAIGYTPYNNSNPANYISGINSSMVNSALGYTPYNSSNPSGYISGISSSMVITALGYTPYSSINPAGYITAASASTLINKTGNISQWTNDSGFLTAVTSSAITTALGYTPVTNARTISTTSPLTGGGDLTANRTLAIDFSVGNTWTGTQTYLKTGLGTTPVIAEEYTNTTAATSSVQQYSPATVWTGQGWKTNATAASQPVSFRIYAQPTAGAANPTGYFLIQNSINGAAWANSFYCDTAGNSVIPGTIQVVGTATMAAINSSGNVNAVSFNISSGTATQTGAINQILNTTVTTTTANYPVALNIGTGFTVASGSATFTGLRISPVINQTGTATGNTFVLWLNPTYTSVTGDAYGIYGGGAGRCFVDEITIGGDMGKTKPTWLYVAAGTSSKSQLLLVTSAAYTGTPTGGLAVWSDGSNIFTRTTANITSQLSTTTPRLQTTASATTVTPDAANDIVTITALAANLTIANPTGTAVEGQSIVIRIKDNGTARTISFGTIYRAMGITLPTTTTASKNMYLAMIYNGADTKWDVTGLSQEA